MGRGEGLTSGIPVLFYSYAYFFFIFVHFLKFSGLTKFAAFYASILTALFYIVYEYAHSM